MKETLSCIVLVCSILTCRGQEIYNVTTGSELYIYGTSTLHDWDMRSDSLSGFMEVLVTGNRIDDMEGLEIRLPVRSLQSDSRRMSRNAWEAMQEEENPLITFRLYETKNISPQDESSRIAGSGQLNVAGVEYEVDFTSDCSIVNEDEITCKGEFPLLMTYFKIDPPSALFGSLKTEDEILISFDIRFVR